MSQRGNRARFCRAFKATAKVSVRTAIIGRKKRKRKKKKTKAIPYYQELEGTSIEFDTWSLTHIRKLAKIN